MFRQLVSIELVHELVMANGTHTYFGYQLRVDLSECSNWSKD